MTHPFSAAYWRAAAAESRDLRKVVFAALMIALCIVLGYLPAVTLPYGGRVTWGFLARALCGYVCGPVLGILFGFAEDILSFFLTGGGGYPFFFGYTLTTMLGVLIYSLFLYRADLTVRRVFLAKLLTNVENVALGALWMSILSGKAYLATATASAVKNLVMLPVQTAVLCGLLSLLSPYLKGSGLVPGDPAARLRL
ncbi:MAG: folate family ECF transporter S component [Oscillibacter sp.]|nr:folate family ECF transporter S component [Oscillibacter sp.]